MRTGLVAADIRSRLPDLIAALFEKIPCGVGVGGALPRLDVREVDRILSDGARWAVARGYGTPASLEVTEEGGVLQGASPDAVSSLAKERGARQLGTLGSGNHFLEIDRVEEIFHPEMAGRCGLQPDGVVLIIHSGSRGLGYQVCEDSLGTMEKAMRRHAIQLPDRQLACAPIQSEEGRTYLAAMAAAANFAWCNRQVMMALAEQVFLEVLGIPPRSLDLGLVYDVCHNIAKFEEHTLEGAREKVCVHRKGATRAFGPGRPEVPRLYRDLGQPVLIPGDMARGSYLLCGTGRAMERTFGSTCHGAGRVMSRTQSRKACRGRDLVREMERQGVTVRAYGRGTLAEEMPHAYKDVSDVVAVMEAAGISLRVARFAPMGVIKG